jgi:hypothetical protein
LVVA